ncbi:GNAT family N-acetyltransferase [Geodermatophilus sp. SYSU D00766]
MARALLTDLLARGRERGAAVSALYPTVSAVYRRLGWEVVGALQRADLDTASLPSAPVPGVDVRPGEPADLAVLDALYETVAGRGRGCSPAAAARSTCRTSAAGPTASTGSRWSSRTASRPAP